MRLLALATLLVAASACDSGWPDFTGLGGLSQDASLLVGTWEWTRSYGCGDGSRGCDEQTPRSTGRTETFTFSTDGTVDGFFNGGHIDPTPYETRERCLPDLPCTGYLRLVQLYGDNTVDVFGVSRDRLVLTAAYRDG